MSHSALNALSPLDGRYADKTGALQPYFSESALIRYRVKVEIEYFISLCEEGVGHTKDVDAALFSELRTIYTHFSAEDAQVVKGIEKTTNHDVKAVEYFLKEKFEGLGLGAFSEYIHFGLTSQDINNTAVPLAVKEAWIDILKVEVWNVIELLRQKAAAWMAIPMLAHTHGQPASPTRLGKEIMVFVERLEKQYQRLQMLPFSAKFGGATGNFNAHHVAFPEVDWIDFGNRFLNDKLGLERQQTTTQIEHYDDLSTFFSGMQRINTILIDFSRDIWSYISMNYFKQQIKAGEVGSSAMPHKVNPIDFENAEGNLGIANAMLVHFELKLPVSRLQRDLTDSTVSRNFGVPFGHLLIALKSLQKGVGKLIVNEKALIDDLENNWAVVAEAIQTILRREGFSKPYEKLKELTRTNQAIDKVRIHQFVDTLEVSEQVKEELKAISPFNYTGLT